MSVLIGAASWHCRTLDPPSLVLPGLALPAHVFLSAGHPGTDSLSRCLDFVNSGL